MFTLQNISYIHPNKDLLFSNITFTLNQHDKIALIGNNGVGKSTLLKIIAGQLQTSAGQVKLDLIPYYVPQIFGQYDHLTIASAMKVGKKLKALKSILDGIATEENYAILNDDWGIEERCEEALNYWQLTNLDLDQPMESLSGGQKTRVLLAGISIHQPQLVLLDEPSNHLDISGRKQLYQFIESTSGTLVIVSHDRKLLNLLDTTCEMQKDGITAYGGNYDFYTRQKEIAINSLNQDLESKEKQLRKAKEIQRETLERQQKMDARGKKKQAKSGVPKVMMNKMKNDAQNSSSKLKGTHTKKIEGISKELQELRTNLADIDQMKFGFENSGLHKGKVLLDATNLNFSYGKKQIWKNNLNIQILSGERIALKGHNGSGKTTLIKLILGDLKPQIGPIKRADFKSIYIDQDYSLINNQLSIYEQAQQFNTAGLQEHEVKIRLNRFLFTQEMWDKPCLALSGGERMRLLLCCLTINQQAPDLIILDEPTNNLDIQNIEILTKAINQHQGTLIVVSHDESFLEEVRIQRVIELKK